MGQKESVFVIFTKIHQKVYGKFGGGDKVHHLL